MLPLCWRGHLAGWNRRKAGGCQACYPASGSRRGRAVAAAASSASPSCCHAPQVRQALQDTVCSFKVTNEELALKGAGNAQDVAACDIACKVPRAELALLP